MTELVDLTGEAELADGLLGYLPQILYQRRWFVLIPFAASGLAGVGLAYGLPAHYQSSATVVVESKELPEAIAAASVTDLIDQRIARIKQQILSRPGLIELIQNNDLYKSERRKKSLSTIIDLMRDATAITPVTADIDKLAARRGGSSTIAFSISFTYSDPTKAQAVTQQFTEKLLKLDSSQLSAQADATVGFLRDQASQIQGQVSEIEGKIEDIKGLKVRVQATATEDTMFPAYGAQTVHMPFGSVYTSLQTGVMDVAENGVNVYLVNKHYEVAPILSMTQHEANNSFVWVSDKLWQSLSAEQKGWVQAAADEVNKQQPGKALDLETQSATKLKAIGVKIVEVDKSGFLKVAQPMLEKMAKDLGPHAAKIQQLISAIQ